jgi:hypothetical protein
VTCAAGKDNSAGKFAAAVVHVWCAQPAKALSAQLRVVFAEGREQPLDKYRNIGIMAHIDAGKVGAASIAAACAGWQQQWGWR